MKIWRWTGKSTAHLLNSWRYGAKETNLSVTCAFAWLLLSQQPIAMCFAHEMNIQQIIDWLTGNSVCRLSMRLAALVNYSNWNRRNDDRITLESLFVVNYLVFWVGSLWRGAARHFWSMHAIFGGWMLVQWNTWCGGVTSALVASIIQDSTRFVSCSSRLAEFHEASESNKMKIDSPKAPVLKWN